VTYAWDINSNEANSDKILQLKDFASSLHDFEINFPLHLFEADIDYNIEGYLTPDGS